MTKHRPRYFPICLDLTDRPCTVVGGGKVAERKITSLLEHGVRVRVISPLLSEALSLLYADHKIEWLARAYQAGDLAGSFLVIAATDDPVVQERVHAEAEELRILLNVADVPQWCNFILPAVARRGDLSIAISTAGKSPALAGKLRRQMEAEFGPEYAVLLNMLGALRDRVLAKGRPHRENKALFAELVAPDLAQWIKAGQWEKVTAHLARLLGPEELPLNLEQRGE